MKHEIQSYQDVIKYIPLMADVDDDWPEDDYKFVQDAQRRHLLAQSSGKMWNYFFDVIKKDYFIDLVVKVRAKCNMPIQGYNPELPNAHLKLFGQGNTDRHKVFPVIKKICNKYGFNYETWKGVFEEVVYFGKPVFFFIDNFFDLSLIRLVDVSMLKSNKKLLSNDYPVALLFTPAVGRRDVENFIKFNWKRIARVLSNFKNFNLRVDKIRNRPKQKINQFIFNMFKRGLKPREVASSANKKFGTALTYADVNDVIKIEKKRRK